MAAAAVGALGHPVLAGAMRVTGVGTGEGEVASPLYDQAMPVTCVDCAAEIPGAARQRRRCDSCREQRRRSYQPPIRRLRPDEEPPAGQPRRYSTGLGYIVLRWRTSEGYVDAYEHRLLTHAEPGQHVHHIDGDRANNSLGNLLVLDPVAHREIHAGRNRRIDLAAATRLYQNGVGTERIARFLGHDPSAVYRALKRSGVQIRTGYGGPKRKAL